MRFAPTLRFLRRDAAARSAPDPADLGTAFGLDACLDETGSSDYRTHKAYEQLESQSPQSPRAAQDSPLAWLNRRPA